MTIGVFLQARLDSTRLPRKALLPLGRRTVVEQAMLSLAPIAADVYALLTDGPSAGELSSRAEACGFELFAGEKDDVLKRYGDAVRHFGVDLVVRATGDNPLVSAELAQAAINQSSGWDYTGYVGSPLGTGVEVLRAEALLKAEQLAEDPYDREHVAPYIYNNPSLFSIKRIPVPEELELSYARVTLDTLDDFDLITRIYRDLYRDRPVAIRTLVEWLRADARARYAHEEMALRLSS
mgnify:CR=1 FL=1